MRASILAISLFAIALSGGKWPAFAAKANCSYWTCTHRCSTLGSQTANNACVKNCLKKCPPHAG
jgi:hypothetical protein